MSLATARVRDSARSALPRLRLLVSPPHPRRRPKFITACVGVLVGCLLVLLLLNIGLARGAYRERELTLQQTALTEQEQALNEQVTRQNSPAALAGKARDLGMIENPTPAFITLSDGTVLGEPRPAQAPAEDYDPASLTRRPPPAGSYLPPGVDPAAPPADIDPPAGAISMIDPPGSAAGAEASRGDGAVPVDDRAARPGPGAEGASGSDAPGGRVDDGAVPVAGGRR